MTPPSTSAPALDLRCRDAEWIDRPATVAEFGAAQPLPPAQRFRGLGETLVADAVARERYELASIAEGRVVLSCQMPRYGILLGVRDLDRPALEDWHIREEISAELIDLIERESGPRQLASMATQLRRGLIAVAGSLPLLAAPTLAHASDPPGPQIVEASARVGPAPASAGQDQDQAAGEAPSASTPTTTTAAPPTPAPASVPAPRVGASSLSLTGSALWNGLLDKQVRLEMKDGSVVTGTLVAQSSADLALARSSDGTVVSVPKAEISTVRMRPQSADIQPAGGTSDVPLGDRPTQDGSGLTGAGIALVSIGSILSLSGTVMLALSPYYIYISLPLLLPGLALIGGGSGMIAAGGKKRKAFNQAWGLPKSTRLQLLPTVSASRRGGQAGLVLRF